MYVAANYQNGKSMTHLHRQILDSAVADNLDLAPLLEQRCIYITGASGFLAASCIAFLHELRRQSGVPFKLVASARRPLAQVPLFSFLDMRLEIEWAIAPAETCELPAGMRSIVIHTASYGAPADYMREPISTFSANTDGLINLFRQHSLVEHLVYFSSAEVYGQPPDHYIPTTEECIGGLPTLCPRSIYGESKRMAEVLGVTLAAQHRVPFTVLRPWNLYGPGQRLDDGRVPIEFIRQAVTLGQISLLSNGAPTRSLCFVWDGIAQIARTLVAKHDVCAYNIGNGDQEIPILDLARLCAATAEISQQSVHYNPRARASGLLRCLPSVDKVCALFPRPPTKTPLHMGLRTLVDWFHYFR